MQTSQLQSSIKRQVEYSAANLSATIYITCSGLKGLPRKPIAVCRQCRRRKKCIDIQAYIQPELPFVFEGM